MDLNNLGAFRVMKERLSWIGQRQEVIARNIANADTPGYRPQDLQPFTFRMAMGEQRQLKPAVTQAGHMPGPKSRDRDAKVDRDRNYYETAPDGNQVVLEQQMMKVADNGMNYQMVTNLYRKQVGIIKMVVAKGP